MIPGSGRSPGEGTGYPLQHSWASLVAQMVKNLPAMWDTWVRFLVWEDLLEEGLATHSSILAWRSPMDCKSPGSSVPRIFQARILERVATSFSRGSSDPGIKPVSPTL